MQSTIQRVCLINTDSRYMIIGSYNSCKYRTLKNEHGSYLLYELNVSLSLSSYYSSHVVVRVSSSYLSFTFHTFLWLNCLISTKFVVRNFCFRLKLDWSSLLYDWSRPKDILYFVKQSAPFILRATFFFLYPYTTSYM